MSRSCALAIECRHESRLQREEIRRLAPRWLGQSFCFELRPSMEKAAAHGQRWALFGHPGSWQRLTASDARCFHSVCVLLRCVGVCGWFHEGMTFISRQILVVSEDTSRILTPSHRASREEVLGHRRQYRHCNPCQRTAAWASSTAVMCTSPPCSLSSRKRATSVGVDAHHVRMHHVDVAGRMWHLTANFLCDTLSQVRVGDSPPQQRVDSSITPSRMPSPLLLDLLVDSVVNTTPPHTM